MWYYYIIGYLFSIIGSLLFVRIVVNTMWNEIGWEKNSGEDKLRPHAWHSRAVGTIESVLYTSSWLLEIPEFIAIWLALKVAGRWGRWERDEGKVTGRTVYNIFLIGNGLVIAFSTTGAFVTKWLLEEKAIEIYLFPIALIIGTIGLWFWARWHHSHSKK